MVVCMINDRLIRDIHLTIVSKARFKVPPSGWVRVEPRKLKDFLADVACSRLHSCILFRSNWETEMGGRRYFAYLIAPTSVFYPSSDQGLCRRINRQSLLFFLRAIQMPTTYSTLFFTGYRVPHTNKNFFLLSF